MRPLLEEYLDIMDTAVVVIRIYQKTSCGVISFKCSCTTCFVRGCCQENVIWSMVLSPCLVLPPKYSKLEQGARIRRGRPTSTDKRVAKPKEAAAEVDARDSVSLCSQGGITGMLQSNTNRSLVKYAEIPDQPCRRQHCAYVPWTGRICRSTPHPPHLFPGPPQDTSTEALAPAPGGRSGLGRRRRPSSQLPPELTPD